MHLVDIIKRFPDQESCIKQLEKARWGDMPVCPYCTSTNTYPLKGELRHHCNACRKSFSVTVGTIFHDSRLPMQKWFLAIALVLDAKKGISARQLARHLDVNKDTAWSMGMRIREAMKDDGKLLSGIIEMDETYVGGKPRKGNKRDDDSEGGNTSTRGRGTKKTPVIGAVERGGRVKAKAVTKLELRAAGLRSLVRENIDVANSLLLTDEYKGYAGMNRILPHKTINHQHSYIDALIHTNGIESFWALLKRGIVGQYHKVSARHLNSYVAEFCYRYNARKSNAGAVFDSTLARMLLAA